MRQSILLAAFSAISAVAAQANFTVDPATVDGGKRSSWCGAQYDSCNILCQRDVSANDCDSETLKFDCICRSNNSAPGLQYYLQTMPTFICEQAYQNCIEENVGDSRAQDNCRTNIQSKCGTISPANATFDSPNQEEESSSAAPSSSPTGTDEEPASSTSTSSSFAMATAAIIGNGAALAAAGAFAAALL